MWMRKKISSKSHELSFFLYIYIKTKIPDAKTTKKSGRELLQINATFKKNRAFT